MQLVYLFFYQLLTCLAAAQGDSTDGFDSPPDGTGAYNITEGSSFQIEWHTELTFVALTLWHDGSNDYEYLCEYQKTPDAQMARVNHMIQPAISPARAFIPGYP